MIEVVSMVRKKHVEVEGEGSGKRSWWWSRMNGWMDG